MDLVTGMHIANLRAGATGRRAPGLAGKEPVAAAQVDTKPSSAGGGNNVVDPKADSFADKGGVLPDESPMYNPDGTTMVATTPDTVPTQLVPPPRSAMDRFNALPTATKVGVVGGGVVAVAGLIWLLRG